MDEPNDKPASDAPAWENIPAELADRPQWMLWRFEEPDKPGGKWRKMPYYLSGGRRQGEQGSDEDRSRLATLQAVRRAYDKARGRWDGVGFAFLPGDGLIGIDIDGAIDLETGEVDSRCLEIIEACASFTERSVSGTGVHIIVSGETRINKCDDIGLEVYCGRQYFICTGRLWAAERATIEPIDDRVLRRLHRTIDLAKEAKKQRYYNERAAASPKPAGTPKSGADDFATVNDAALRNFDAWVPHVLPMAKRGKKGYRVSSKDLGRNLQEDLSLHDTGITDWGEERTMTAIDVVMQYLPAVKPRDAMLWLAQRLGIDVKPASPPKLRSVPTGTAPAPAATPDAAAGPGSDGPPSGRFPSGGSDGGGGEDEFAEIRLITGKGGKPEDCRENVLYCLRGDPELSGLVAHNEFTELQDKTREPPWGGKPGEWTEEDDLMLSEHLARNHGLLVRGLSTLRGGVQMAARENRYHPILNRLRSVKWDRVDRLDTWLVDCLGAEDRPYVRMISRFFVMGMTARLLWPGCKFDYMLILQGLQGEGKSSALRTLVGREWFTDTPFRIGDKDSYLSMQGVWLVEFSELENMSKAESKAIKAFISSQEDRFRPPYGSRPVKMPRRVVLAGSTNEDQFLKDATGERRFWPVHCSFVRLDLIEANREQLFAEAMHRLVQESGSERARYYPTRDEEKQFFHIEQDRWRMVDVWTDILGDYVNRKEDGLNDVAPIKRAFFPTQELFDKALGIKPERMDNARLQQGRVASAMRELGFTADRQGCGARKRGYMRPGWEFLPQSNEVRKIEVQAPAPAPEAPPPSTTNEGDGLPI